MRTLLYGFGFRAFACYSTISLASASIKKDAGRSFIVDVDRDWGAVTAAVEAGKQPPADKSLISGFTELDWSYYWFMNITAGSEPVSVLMDTGSADLWLRAPNSGPDPLNGVQTWNPDTATNTYKRSDLHFDLSYGVGGNGVNGDVYQSDVCVGSACASMALGSATHCQGLGFVHSGIMGFAFGGGNSIRPQPQPVFMESLLPQLDEPIFVTRFGVEGDRSQIAFGSNPFNYQPPLQNLSIQSSPSDRYPYSWSYSGINYYKDGQYLGTFNMVFDTGGPSTSAHIDIVRRYYNGIQGARDVNGDGSHWTVPCGTQLPNLTMYLGDALLIIPGWRFYNGNKQTSGDCTVWFVKENSPDRGVAGNPFFAEHVVIFNQAESTLHWANQV